MVLLMWSHVDNFGSMTYSGASHANNGFGSATYSPASRPPPPQPFNPQGQQPIVNRTATVNITAAYAPGQPAPPPREQPIANRTATVNITASYAPGQPAPPPREQPIVNRTATVNITAAYAQPGGLPPQPAVNPNPQAQQPMLNRTNTVNITASYAQPGVNQPPPPSNPRPSMAMTFQSGPGVTRTSPAPLVLVAWASSSCHLSLVETMPRTQSMAMKPLPPPPATNPGIPRTASTPAALPQRPMSTNNLCAVSARSPPT